MEGRLALVTGAGSGTGRAIATELALAGADVVLVARTESSIQDAAESIREAGGRATGARCDVTDSGALRALIEGLPRLDVLVNNAGTNHPRPFAVVSDEELSALIRLNMRATYVAAQAAVKKMLSLGTHGGSIVNITSQMGHVGSSERTVYCMTKHGVEGLTKSLAVELAPWNIRVNSVAPTFVDTPLIRRIVNTSELRASLLARIPIGRMARELDIAAAVAYLVSPLAAMVTGTCLRVDGGWTAQ